MYDVTAGDVWERTGNKVWSVDHWPELMVLPIIGC
jgi:hypothetical protein